MPAQAPVSPENKELSDLIAALPEGNLLEEREPLVATIEGWRSGYVSALEESFLRNGDAAALLKGMSALTDNIISVLYTQMSPTRTGVSVIATGGYGRGEMFPYSDVDLLFLYRPAASKTAEHIARHMLYVLWDLGYKVGHALRTLEDSIRLSEEDVTIRTALLDARCVVGDEGLFEAFTERYNESVTPESRSEFVEKKLLEQEARQYRFGDSRYMLEPNIKENKGGLRDLNLIEWLVKYVYGSSNLRELIGPGYVTEEECQALKKAKHFLWRLRAHLHFVAGKAEERLSFDRQQAIAPRMGYGEVIDSDVHAVENMMRDYFLAARTVGTTTRIVCTLLEERHAARPRQPLAVRLHHMMKLDGFTLRGDRLMAKSEDQLVKEPLRMFRLFHIAQKYGYDVHPRTLQWVTRHLDKITTLRSSPAAGDVFFEILLSRNGPMRALKLMNECGLLGAYIPEFGAIVGKMQFNRYHLYTVDEHTIVALGEMYAIASGRLKEDMPLLKKSFLRVHSPRVLYLSLLCHDLAKGESDDHSAEGAKIARKIATQLGMRPQEIDLVAWLVEHHLLFSHTATKRDINDPATVEDFAATVQTVERLRLLLLLTVADISAVGPGIWNAWKASLLQSLFLRTEHYLRYGTYDEREVDHLALQKELKPKLDNWTEEEIGEFLDLCSEEFLSASDADSCARVAKLLRRRELEHLPLALDLTHAPQHDISSLAVVMPDQKGLFSKLAGGITLSGANISSARIYTLKNGMIVDFFALQDNEGKAFEGKSRASRLATTLQKCVTAKTSIAAELEKKKGKLLLNKESLGIEGQVYIENDVSAAYTVIEISGKDRPGLLHDVTRTISNEGLVIHSAHISTYGSKAVDVFYVKDGFGLKVTHEKKLEQLKAGIMKVLEPE